jgi:hypothetical protein
MNALSESRKNKQHLRGISVIELSRFMSDGVAALRRLSRSRLRNVAEPSERQRHTCGTPFKTSMLLWSGRIADRTVKDEDTEGVRACNKLLFADDRYYSTIIPLRDGVAIGLPVR